MSNMNDWIRAAAGRAPGARQPAQPAPDLERAAELAEQIGCTVHEAIGLVANHVPATRATLPEGHAGAGMEALILESRPDMNLWIRKQATGGMT